MNAVRFKHAALGGTFDRFHAGHAQLITTALANADHIVIGITTDKNRSSKHLSHLIEPFTVRRHQLEAFCDSKGCRDRVTLLELSDIVGPTLSDPTIDALVVTPQTQSGGFYINDQRQNLNLPPLPLISASMIKDELGGYLSSTKIRQGLISRSGRAYTTLFKQTIHFSDDLLQKIHQPQGKIIQSTDLNASLFASLTTTVLVGDVITAYFLDHQIPFNLAIIDGRSQRQPIAHSKTLPSQVIGDNAAGEINHATALKIVDIISQKNYPSTIIQVNGEEDLLAFVPTLVGPLGGAVFYGQRQAGIVMITLSESEKIRLARLIDPTFV
jgi:pantetheine-phosphate adenylyltransferase